METERAKDFMPTSPVDDPSPATLSRDLLVWYDRHRRDLPWRAPPGQTADPYRVWLSEIMLQQTTVATVGPYFDRFMARWPTVTALAAASLDEVLHLWQGLGYYARARNMHACAVRVTEAHGGRFPDTEAALLTLPGIGAYTAAAIAAIAFERPAAVMDGNVERVLARLYRIDTPLPRAKPVLRELAGGLTPRQRPGDHAQAMMDLGATICTPRRPRCVLCPLRAGCRALAADMPERFPVKPPKRPRPTRHGVAFWLVRADGAVLLRRRADKGLLGGMMEIPTTDWLEAAPGDPASRAHESPLPMATFQLLPGEVEHVFTHFRLLIRVLAGRVVTDAPAPRGSVWVAPAEFGRHALPTIMKKIVRHAAGPI